MVQCVNHGHSNLGSYLWQQLYTHCKSTSPWKGSPEIRIACAGSKKSFLLQPNTCQLEWSEGKKKNVKNKTNLKSKLALHYIE